MVMDWVTVLLCGGFVVISAGVLLFISMVVTKEKSYEEAIAEQRQQTSMLLGVHSKTKLKDKKQKKAVKKVKEKLSTVINGIKTVEESANVEVETTDTTSSLPNSQAKHHVEFKEPQVLEEPAKEVKETVKRRSKKDKVRPILLNRDMSVEKIAQVDEVPLANHFEQLHPKDDFELMHSHIKEEAVKQEPAPKEKPTKAKQVLNKSENENIENKSNKKAVKQQTNEGIAQNLVEKKEEPVTEQDIIVPQTNGLLLGANNNSGKEKKKKKSEQNTIQQLASDKQGVNLQILTTLVRKAELSRSEVQILIDMLLNKQHEAPTIIDEWSEGKADPVQKLKKQLAEKEKLLAQEQEALIGAQAKLKEVRAEQAAERSQLQQKARGLDEALNAKQLELQAANTRIHGLNQKLQALQTQINDELMKSHKLFEDNKALQMHIQQMENQCEEVKETMENDLRSLSEQFENQKSIVIHLQYELSQKGEVMKQLEEQRIDMDRRLNLYMIQDNEHKNEIQQLNSTCQQHLEEIRRLELNKNQSMGELNTQREEYEKTISQLSQELQRATDEKQKIEACRAKDAVEEKKGQIKIKNLQNELSSHIATIENLKSELEQQKVKNNELRERNWKVMEALNAAEDRNKKQAATNLESDIASLKEERLKEKKLLERLFPTVKIDGNLPYDEWFVQMEIHINKYIKDLETPKAVPDVSKPVDTSEILKLRLQLQQNKKSLDEYDILLNKIEKNAADAEIEWQKEIGKKDVEITARDKVIEDKDNIISLVEEELKILKEEMRQLRSQSPYLKTQLHGEHTVNERLTNDGALNSNQGENAQSGTALEVGARLEQELNRVSEQLPEEQITNKELRIQIEAISNLSAKTINHNNASNGPTVTIEKLLSSTSSAASSVSEVLIKKIKKKKKHKKNN